ncbi:GAF domain-containing protein [Sediminicoccus rosea]|jgi:GAF domain-containing protein|uniref:GAF domain-containing protein n=1 Tax=Sediminicoccus rosea TaxID=1225128 RepID=A0ABZ0PLX4_9PROT|nr:GAF domain-containing protein [Sediminicoccus rosea]WPB86743.1 GAF domain-containing protein [Sediminicoccus rosea]
MEQMAGFARIAAEGAAAHGPEEALYAITRALPALLGDPSAALRPNAFRESPPPTIGAAAVAFMVTADRQHHMITAPVNFAPEQYHELVDIRLGHPGEVAKTRQPMLLRDTALHSSFVKILQSFRAGSSMFAPILWQDEYLGVLICANAARNTFGEADLIAHRGFAALAASLWVAQGGPAWMAAQDLSKLPRRSVGT